MGMDMLVVEVNAKVSSGWRVGRTTGQPSVLCLL